ncbi:uncharacterized protein RJT21DRAFT_81020 [Scheffersomyces amazonensis]|uniref:uncharacterized protein n=1 Tax=Scheffersomyces amazonensis TaxID=1078765 RepID=UPI00315D948C
MSSDTALSSPKPNDGLGSGSGDDIDSKPKRQRRSYSCGPCKLLKIKCDLTIPCTSCQRFKRTDKCLLHPPQPPSQEELYKIKERRKRTNIKKLRLTNNLVQTFNTNGESLPSLATSITNVSRQITANIDSPMKYSTVDLNRYASIPYPAIHQQTSPPNGLSSIPPPNLPPRYFPNYPATQQPYSQFSHQYLVPLPPIQNQLSFQQSYHPINQQDSHPLSTTLIDQQLAQDKTTLVALSMVDVKRIKRLLPHHFNIFETLIQLYLKSMNDQIMDIMNYEALQEQIKTIYAKFLSINDEDSTKLTSTIEFNVIELRALSLGFILLANGYLFDTSNLNHFLLERSIFKSKQDIMKDWVNISKFIKQKIISYNKITDILYLLDWYFVIKNYYTYSGQIVENYLEFNNLLNYAVLNNQFMEFIEDPDKEQITSSSSEQNSNIMGNDSNQTSSYHHHQQNSSTARISNASEKPYPQSFEFKLLARYWMQLRLVEIEFTFFQYKGSLLSSNQLKTTIVPHKQLLQSLYGDNLSSITNPLVKFAIQVWGLYYKRSRYSTSIKDIIKSYLELYGDILSLYLSEIKEQESLLFSDDGCADLNAVIGPQELDIFLKNQIALTVFIRWLSFIRIETNYFPSLRYTSYLTSMMNLFNHFNMIDEIIRHQSPNQDLVTILIHQYPYHYIRNFYQCLIYQAIFLIILQDFILVNDQKFKMDLKIIYETILSRFESTYSKFANNKTASNHLHQVKFFKTSFNLVSEFNKFLHDNKASSLGDLTELIYQIKMNYISYENWEILINFYFGSRENFMRYIEKIWDLFEFLKGDDSKDIVNGKSNKLRSQNSIPITSSIFLNDQLILDNCNKLTGFEFDSAIVLDYIRTVVEPNIQE